MNARLIPPLILAAILGIFALQNTTVLTVSFLIWSFKISQSLLIVLCGTLGLLLGILLAVSRKLRRKITA